MGGCWTVSAVFVATGKVSAGSGRNPSGLRSGRTRSEGGNVSVPGITGRAIVLAEVACAGWIGALSVHACAIGAGAACARPRSRSVTERPWSQPAPRAGSGTVSVGPGCAGRADIGEPGPACAWPLVAAACTDCPGVRSVHAIALGEGAGSCGVMVRPWSQPAPRPGLDVIFVGAARAKGAGIGTSAPACRAPLTAAPCASAALRSGVGCGASGQGGSAGRVAGGAANGLVVAALLMLSRASTGPPRCMAETWARCGSPALSGKGAAVEGGAGLDDGRSIAPGVSAVGVCQGAPMMAVSAVAGKFCR